MAAGKQAECGPTLLLVARYLCVMSLEHTGSLVNFVGLLGLPSLGCGEQEKEKKNGTLHLTT